MKNIVKASFLCVIMLMILADGFSQTIRKPWRELTQDERTVYVLRIWALYTSGIWQDYVDTHNPSNGYSQHGNDLFLPWHRYYLYYMEKEMDVPLVYWDWEYDQNGLTEWSASSPMFSNSNGGTDGLFGRNLISSHANSLGRTLNFGTPPSGVVAGYLNITDFTNFRGGIEGGLHNTGHCRIGGIMCNISASPTDPTFYLHHSMVDKVYQEWVESHWNGSNLFSTSSIQTIPGEPNENPNDHIDSRTLKVWYAENNLLLLDDYESSGTEDYSYSSGAIVAEDFVIPSSSSCNFTVDNSYTITLKTGFKALNGSGFSAKRTDIADNGRTGMFAKNRETQQNNLRREEAFAGINVFPNPSSGSFEIFIPDLAFTSVEYYKDYIDVNLGFIEVYNSKGKLVHKEELFKSSASLNLEINPGLYIVKVNSLSNVYSSKVIIQ